MRSVDWRDGAAASYRREYRFYERIRPELGSDFEKRIDLALTGMVKRPLLGTKVSRNVYRVIVRQFPFLIYYRVHESTIEIIALRNAVMKPIFRATRTR